MPYISRLLNNKIYDSSDLAVGKLEDILISPKNGTFSPLEFLEIKTFADHAVRYVPYAAVENFSSSEISLKNLFGTVSLTDLPGHPFIRLKRDVLDQQIVDVGGTRVVRVNDLRIGNFENRICVLAIDSSFRGLLRRLGLSGSFLAWPFTVHLIDWRQAQLLGSRGTLQLNTMAEHLSELHPADLANIVEELDIKRGTSLLESLKESDAAKVLEEVDIEWQNILVKNLGPEKAAKILSYMSTDEIVDLAKTFTSEESQKFLAGLAGGRAENIAKLASYPDNTAGGLMTTDYVSADPGWTVARTIEEIKKQSPKMRSILYVYVVGPQGQLKGVVSMRRLVIADTDLKMSELVKRLRNYDTLKPDDKVERIITLMTKYNLYVAAVVDAHNKMLGVVTIDDIMRQQYPAA